MALEINLAGQVALVTGVSSGIGEGVAKVLAKAGAIIVGCARAAHDDPQVVALGEEIAAVGSTLTYVRADVKEETDLIHVVNEAVAQHGGIDIVVSNAGANVFKGAEHCTTEEWEHNFDLNLKSHWLLAKYSLPYLRKSSNGTLLIMGSNHGVATMPGCFPYNVSKTALIGLVRSLAIEWGPEVRTIGIAPGFVETRGATKWFDSFPDPQAEYERTIALHPAGKLGTPEEIGGFCAFLASPYAAFATGSTYVIDGGRTAMLQDSE
ncbi:SDR family NAD(P)-dependent oxidoreductase [Paenibacillus yanchengensis]|uniref:SDR family NAD(P)-dependent oxidoreductase n=1 Tax=Paenibacillus yanchengensis TaxID=2035833 RepID=A0ABW4YPR3_9BACL